MYSGWPGPVIGITIEPCVDNIGWAPVALHELNYEHGQETPLTHGRDTSIEVACQR